ncbi:iron uptake system protein EfeO [Nocardioides panacisoli]|uniref:Peptidase M75 family protein n=1 Tax=Nocardioides panacisoli TaxID=627624 RepID=A0ABP7I225_9ACTN
MRKPVLVAALAALPLLAACTENASDSSGDDRHITVTADDDACEVSTTSAPSGHLTFEVTNKGDKVTEFYLYKEDGKSIAGEVENVGPQTTQSLTVTAAAGKYVTACKPGMEGDGIRGDFTVTDSGEEVTSGADADLVEQAQEQYAAYVEKEAGALLKDTTRFVNLYSRNQDDAARALYPVARSHWERIEPVAESFGDLDPKMDAREADVDFAAGEKWTGWHVIEKDLWPARAGKKYDALTPAVRKGMAADLLKNTKELVSRIKGEEYGLDQITNGARGLLEEVATGKITGEEEYWSRTDLYDFQANVDGAKEAFEAVEPILDEKDPALEQELDTRFGQLQDLLDQHRQGKGFETYDQLSKAEIDDLANAVNALSEPLSELTATVVS